MGLHRAGFDVTGVDINNQPRYPFKFIRADAMSYPFEGFDFVWASPPCQRYSCVTPTRRKMFHPDLLVPMMDRLFGAIGRISFCIENVVGARSKFFEPFMLCGSMFGLRCERHRLFETSFQIGLVPSCNHSKAPLLVTTAGSHSRRKGNFKSVKNAPLAYGIDWMRGNGLKEAIPPAYPNSSVAKRLSICGPVAPVRSKSQWVSSSTR